MNAAERLPVSRKQWERSRELYLKAFGALESLAEERLNLDTESRDALNETRDALERFDHLRFAQPIDDERVEGRATR